MSVCPTCLDGPDPDCRREGCPYAEPDEDPFGPAYVEAKGRYEAIREIYVAMEPGSDPPHFGLGGTMSYFTVRRMLGAIMSKVTPPAPPVAG